jgi:hypothetical protein
MPDPMLVESGKYCSSYQYVAKTTLEACASETKTLAGCQGELFFYGYGYCFCSKDACTSRRAYGGYSIYDTSKAVVAVKDRGGGCSYAAGSSVADCPSGYTNMGLTCYRPPSTYSQGSRVADCPGGYTNMGATCYMPPDTYLQGSRVADCPGGYTNMGASCYKFPWWSLGMGSMSCNSNEFKWGARCYRHCKSGYTNNGEFCGRGMISQGMGSMSCNSNEFKTGARCYRHCKSGYTNNGEFCGRGAITKGLDSMHCKSDEFHKIGRCFKTCDAGYTNGGEVCTNWDCVENGLEGVGKGIGYGILKTVCGAQKFVYEALDDHENVQKMEHCIRQAVDACGGEMGTCNAVIQCVVFALQEADETEVDPCANAVAQAVGLVPSLFDLTNPKSWITLAQATQCIVENTAQCALEG